MQWKAIYNKETGTIRCTIASEGQIELPDNEAMIDCEPSVNGASHKVNVNTLEFEQLPPPALTADEIQEKIDALLAQKAELEK